MSLEFSSAHIPRHTKMLEQTLWTLPTLTCCKWLSGETAGVGELCECFEIGLGIWSFG